MLCVKTNEYADFMRFFRGGVELRRRIKNNAAGRKNLSDFMKPFVGGCFCMA